MADINIQRKSSSAIWWILGIIALVLVLMFLFVWGGNEGTATAPGARPVSSASVEGPALTG